MKKILLASSKFSPEYSGSGYRAQKLYIRLKKKFDIAFDIYCNSKIYNTDLKNKNYYRTGRVFLNLQKNSILEFFNIVTEIFKTWIYIRKKIKNYSLLHTFGNSYGIAFLTIYFYLHKKPIIREICNIIQTPFYPIQISNLVKKIFQQKNTLIVAISFKIYLICKKFPIKNLWFRCNPVDEKKFFPNYKKKFFLRKKLTDYTKKDIVILYIASFMKQKHHEFLLEVLKKMPTNYKLIIGGPHDSHSENNEFMNVKKKIKLFSLDKRVKLISGFVRNFNEYICLSDVYAFPAHEDEAFGTPVVEAQACGVPVVSNDIKNLTKYIIKKGFGGYYCKLDASTFAKKIMMASKIKKKKLISNSKKILDNGSTKKIDSVYFNKIKNIIYIG